MWRPLSGKVSGWRCRFCEASTVLKWQFSTAARRCHVLPQEESACRAASSAAAVTTYVTYSATLPLRCLVAGHWRNTVVYQAIRNASTMPTSHDVEEDEAISSVAGPPPRRRWMRRMEKDCRAHVREILDLVHEAGNARLYSNYRFLMRRPIYVPSSTKSEAIHHIKGVDSVGRSPSLGTSIPVSLVSLETDTEKEPHVDMPRDHKGIEVSFADEDQEEIEHEDLSQWKSFLAEAEQIDPVRQSPPSRRLLGRGTRQSLALLQAMTRKDWNTIDALDYIPDDDEALDIVGDEVEDNFPDSDQVESSAFEEDTLAAIETTLNLVHIGDLDLDTEDFNLLLCRATCAVDISPDESLKLLMTIFENMGHDKVESRHAADSMTSEIMILALSERHGSPYAALRLAKQLVSSPSLRTADSMCAALRLCHQLNEVTTSLKLWSSYREEDQAAYDLPYDALGTLVRTLRANFLQENAMEVLRHAAKVNSDSTSPGLDILFKAVCAWPPRSRDGREDNTKILEATLELLVTEPRYQPSFAVWRGLIVAASKDSESIDQRRHIVHAALKELPSKFEDYWPDPILMKIGLDTCHAVDDPCLAVDLIARRLAHVVFRLEKKAESEQPKSDEVGALSSSKYDTSDGSVQSIRVSSQEILKAMDICADSEEVETVQAIMSLVEEYEGAFHFSLYRQIASIAIESFIEHGKVESAEALVERLGERGLVPSDKDIGILMHGYVSQGNLQKALDLFGGLKEADGKDGKTQVGASCYNSLFLGYIQERQWKNCLSLYEEMEASGVEPLSSSYSGLVLASFEIGGKPHLVTFLQHLVESKACVSSETAELALKLLLPQVKKEEGYSGIRARLRKMMDDRTEFKDALLDLISAIRVAELEGEENAQKQGEPSSHSDRWTVVLANLLAVVKMEC